MAEGWVPTRSVEIAAERGVGGFGCAANLCDVAAGAGVAAGGEEEEGDNDVAGVEAGGEKLLGEEREIVRVFAALH